MVFYYNNRKVTIIEFGTREWITDRKNLIMMFFPMEDFEIWSAKAFELSKQSLIGSPIRNLEGSSAESNVDDGSPAQDISEEILG